MPCRFAALVAVLFSDLLICHARAEPLVIRDLEYATVGASTLKLDLHVPSEPHQPILIVYVHGGAWRAGSKSDMPLGALVERGFPVASVEYRLSTEAPFPAQIHDIKAAIRFLRADARGHEIDPTRIAIVGSSAGGHLAALAGVTSGVKELEVSVGAYGRESSRVQAIVSFYGASNLQTILSQSTPHGLSVRVPALQLLLGGQPKEVPELARLASPVAHVDSNDPPLLLIHGDADPQMPYKQSVELQRAYEEAEAKVRLVTIAGGKRGGAEFYDDSRTQLVAEFLENAAKRPVATLPDISYGPHPHQAMDLYLPRDVDTETPVLIWFGGLWKPSRHAPDAERLKARGIAVAAVSVRTMTDATREGEPVPISYVMNDACRAVQFLRHNAEKWGLDRKRIAAGGSSQGALPALYLGCAPDRANPGAADRLERESTRVACVIAHRSQPTIDPRRMQEWVPGVQWGAPAFGCSFEESLARRDEFLPVIQRYSPDALLHPGAVPIYFENSWELTRPEGIGEMDYKVHSPAWAIGFQKLAQAAGVACHVSYFGHETEGYADRWDFLERMLKTAR